MGTTKSECNSNLTEQKGAQRQPDCLLCAHIVHMCHTHTHMNSIYIYILYRTVGYRYLANMFGHNITLTAAAAAAQRTRGMPIFKCHMLLPLSKLHCARHKSTTTNYKQCATFECHKHTRNSRTHTHTALGATRISISLKCRARVNDKTLFN